MNNFRIIASNRIGRKFNTTAYPKFIPAFVTWKYNSRRVTCGIWRALLPKENDIEPEVYEQSILKDKFLKKLKHGK